LVDPVDGAFSPSQAIIDHFDLIGVTITNAQIKQIVGEGSVIDTAITTLEAQLKEKLFNNTEITRESLAA